MSLQLYYCHYQKCVQEAYWRECNDTVCDSHPSHMSMSYPDISAKRKNQKQITNNNKQQVAVALVTAPN